MKKLRKEIKRLAKEYDIPESIVKEIFESQFKFIREKIQQIDFSSMTEEEFYKLKYNFNLKHLGKFYTNWNRIKQINEWEK